MYCVNARDHFNCSPLLFSWPAPQNRCGQTEGGGGKYWQLNQSNQHSSRYSTIKCDNTQWIRRREPRINRQNRQITFPGSAYSKEISQQCTPATHTEEVHCQGVLLGSSIPVSDHWRLLDPPWGKGCQTSHQPIDASTLECGCKSEVWKDQIATLRGKKNCSNE